MMPKNSTNITVRAARQEDARIIAEVVAMAIGDEQALRNYCGEEYIGVLTEIARREATQYSWRHALIAEVDGVAAGAVVGYDGEALYDLREGTFSVLRECIGRTPAIVDETETGECYLDSVGVLPAFRTRGVGRALVAAFCDKAYSEGHTRVGLIVDAENPNAERLYTSLGFERVGTKMFFGHQMWHLQRKATPHLDNYHIVEVKERTEGLITMLTEVWEASVRATHHFLAEADICEIREYVPMALTGVAELVIVEDTLHLPIAFMGIEEHRLEMLFIAPEHRGKGIGRRVLQYGIDNHAISQVTVNEQNPSAVGFYEHLGFRRFKRTDHDEEGRPFPLLYMSLQR